MRIPSLILALAALNVHDAGTVNFSDVNFVKYLIETYG